MPRFKNSDNILTIGEEYFSEEWFKSTELKLPDTLLWEKFYTRPITVKDIEIWEILFETSQMNGFFGVYAAWRPYADLFITVHEGKIVSQYLGKDSLEKINNYLEKECLPKVVRYNESAAPIYVGVRR